jgi:hypothetical protein
VTGLITFLIVFGMGVAPLFDEPGATFAQRLFNIGIACVYAFAALTLLDPGTRRAMPLRVRSAGCSRAMLRTRSQKLQRTTGERTRRAWPSAWKVLLVG